MSKLILVLVLSGCVYSAFAADKKKDVEIGWGRAKINKVTPAALKEVNAIKKEKQANTTVSIGKECTNADFKEICQNIPWIQKLETEYGNKNISDFSPLSNLKQLKSLTLRSVKKFDKVPLDLEPLSNLTNLESVDFYATRVKNTDALSKSTKLKDISFYMSGVDSLEFLKNTPDVEKLDLYGFAHTFKDYKPVANLKKLKELNVYMNKTATDANLAVLSNLTSLEKYSTSNNNDFSSFNFLKNCKNMKRINASWCHSLKDISALAGMDKLENVDIADSLVSSLDVLKGKKNLRYLDISGTQIKDLSPLKNCSELKTIEIGETKIKDISILKNFKKLNRIELEDTLVSDISPLAECQDLTSVNLEDSKVKDLSPLLKLKKIWTLSVSKDVPQKEIDKFKKKFPKCDIRIKK